VDVEMKLTRQKSESKPNRDMTPSELESIREIFDFFDYDKSGSISMNELKDLHQKLGEPLTFEEDAAKAMKAFQTATDGQMTFDEFLNWWQSDLHKVDDANKFKLLRGDIKEENFDIKKVKVRKFGGPIGTLEYRMGFSYETSDNEMKDISPWHDIPLYPDKDKKTVHFICEIPKWTRAKYEVATKENLNPIKQDTKNGRLRFYQHGDMMFNYGLLPQTWEDPKHITRDTNCCGDNDPIDAVEIGLRQMRSGEIAVVKVIGILAMIDDNETDWKLFVINVRDPLANLINSVEDLERELPGAIEAAREYFRIYKVCTGKEPNKFGLDEKIMPNKYAMQVIAETHEFWNNLRRENKSTVE